MTSELLTFETRVISPWLNGAGRKADIASGPGWMAGFAWLDAEAPFSDFSGQERTITLLDGPGFTLDFAPPYPALVVRSRHVPARFDGGWRALCRPLGQCLVLNAITVRSQWCHDVRVLTAPIRLPPVTPGAVGFLVDLTTLDTLRLDGPTETRKLPAAHVVFTPVA